MSESRINDMRDDIQEVKEIEGERHRYTTNVVAKLLGICEKLVDELDRQEQRADDQALKLVALQAKLAAHMIRLEELEGLELPPDEVEIPDEPDKPLPRVDIERLAVEIITEKRRGAKKLRRSKGK